MTDVYYKKSGIGPSMSLPPCLSVHEQTGVLQATSKEADDREVNMWHAEHTKGVCSVDPSEARPGFDRVRSFVGPSS
jgi:hypothetical protein